MQSRSRHWRTVGRQQRRSLALTPGIETAGESTPRDQLVMSAIEDASVRTGGRFPRGAVQDFPVTRDGWVDLAAMAEAIRRASRPLVSLMLANNETGVVQPVAEAAAIVHAAGGLFRVDAVQGPGVAIARSARSAPT